MKATNHRRRVQDDADKWLFLLGIAFIGFVPIVVATVFVFFPDDRVWFVGTGSVGIGMTLLGIRILRRRRA